MYPCDTYLDTVDMLENTSPGGSTAPECPTQQRDWHATEEHMGARELMKGDRHIPRKLYLRLQQQKSSFQKHDDNGRQEKRQAMD